MSSDGLANFASLMTIFAALGGVGAAWFGLFAWKAQSKWDVDTQTAQRILVLLYKHKDALAGVRNPFVWTGESDAAIAGKEVPGDKSRLRFFETASVYEKRWERVRLIRADLYPLILEGQAIWEREFIDLFKPIWNLENELAGIVRNYLDGMNPENDEDTRREYRKIRLGKRDVLHDSLAASDPFNLDYNCALTPVEDFLRRKLGRK